MATELVATFPDGVFFVPLAAVTSADVMWTTIADVLDLRRGARSPPRLLEQVAHRAALFVLDNLEQLHGADDVVTAAAGARRAPPSSRPRVDRSGVPGEHLYPVPPLPLPDGSTLATPRSPRRCSCSCSRPEACAPTSG